MPGTILVVDDDEATRGLLYDALEDRYTIVVAADAETAQYQIKTQPPDLILLDLALPDIDGILLISKIRQTSSVPIIVLSARHDPVSVVTALKNGADDVIDKPFDLDDLDARIDVVLRRSNRYPTVSPEPEPQFGELTISAAGGARINGKVLGVPPTERRLLAALLAGRGDPVTREVLYMACWGDVDPNRLEQLNTYIKRLRGRLKRVPGAPIIARVPRYGYQLKENP